MPVTQLGFFNLLRKEDGPCDYYFLIDNGGNAVGRARVDHVKNFVRVGHIWFDPKIRGKGYGFKFYEYLLKSGLRIVSDSDQTRYAQGLWKRLAREFVVRPYDFTQVHTPLKDIMPYYGDAKGLLIASLK